METNENEMIKALSEKLSNSDLKLIEKCVIIEKTGELEIKS